MRKLALSMLCLALAPACATFASTARSTFVHSVICPADRVTVAQAKPEAAPPEIAADAGRLAVWNEDAERRAKSTYVASGCGTERVYRCEKQYSGEGKYQASWIECDQTR